MDVPFFKNVVAGRCREEGYPDREKIIERAPGGGADCDQRNSDEK
jgi:hypothetical protein